MAHTSTSGNEWSFREDIRAIAAFVLNCTAAIVLAALLERVEYISALRQINWVFFRGFGFSFLVAASIGFWVQKILAYRCRKMGVAANYFFIRARLGCVCAKKIRFFTANQLSTSCLAAFLGRGLPNELKH
jgi:hypothetical protein